MDLNKQINNLDFLYTLTQEDQKVQDRILKRKKDLEKKYGRGDRADLLVADPATIKKENLAAFVDDDLFLKDKQEYDGLTQQSSAIQNNRNDYLATYNKAIESLDKSSEQIDEGSRARIRALQSKFGGLQQAAKATAITETGSISAGLRAAADIEQRKQEPINAELANTKSAQASIGGQRGALFQQKAEAIRNQNQFDQDLQFKRDQLAAENATSSGTSSSYSPSSSGSSSSGSGGGSSFNPGSSGGGGGVDEPATPEEEKEFEEQMVKESSSDTNKGYVKAGLWGATAIGGLVGLRWGGKKIFGTKVPGGVKIPSGKTIPVKATGFSRLTQVQNGTPVKTYTQSVIKSPPTKAAGAFDLGAKAKNLFNGVKNSKVVNATTSAGGKIVRGAKFAGSKVLPAIDGAIGGVNAATELFKGIRDGDNFGEMLKRGENINPVQGAVDYLGNKIVDLFTK